MISNPQYLYKRNSEILINQLILTIELIELLRNYGVCNLEKWLRNILFNPACYDLLHVIHCW